MSDVDYGPQAEAVHAIEARFDTLTQDEKKQLVALRDDAFWAGWNVVNDGRARRAGLEAARIALFVHLYGFVGGDSAYGAALAVLLRHTIQPDEWVHYDALVKPWVTVTGQVAHPDDFYRLNNTANAAPIETPATDELEALATMVDLFKGLDNEERLRILSYLSNRFHVGAWT